MENNLIAYIHNAAKLNFIAKYLNLVFRHMSFNNIF